MIEIEWMDGLVTKVPEFALGDVFGESVQVELDFKFDDVSEGLWVEVRHHKPDEGSDGDPRERACTLHADCHYGWSTRSTSTVSSAFSLRGSRGSAASRGSS